MMSAQETQTDLVAFERYVADLKREIRRNYDRSVNRDLSQQHWQGIFKRNVTAVLRGTYDGALPQLQQFAVASANDQPLAQLLKPFDELIADFLHYTLQKHRGSCALSNFPEEHNPSNSYIDEVMQEVNKDWQVFVAQLDSGIRQGHGE